MNEHGDLDGFILDKIWQVYFSPCMSASVAAHVTQGDTVRVQGAAPLRTDVMSVFAIEAEDGETILAAALRQGIGLPYGCKNGACGSCKTAVPMQIPSENDRPVSNSGRLGTASTSASPVRSPNAPDATISASTMAMVCNASTSSSP